MKDRRNPNFQKHYDTTRLKKETEWQGSQIGMPSETQSLDSRAQ